jgi:Protein of unknown function, DUF547
MRSICTRWLFIIITALLTGCATQVPVPVLKPSGPALTADVALASWARVLASHVNTRGEVDFPALARDRQDLDRYVRFVADTPLDSLADGLPRLAHMINAYNALSMFNVIDSGIPDTHAGLKKVTFFLLRKLQVGGAAMSLYAFENDIIRPLGRRLADPRLHFALNCSALACPVLPQTPFTASALHAELERETRAFFARAENFRVDHLTRTVWLSELLNFYPEDFVPLVAPSLLAYANRYVAQPAPLDYTVRFTPYDWTVANSQRSGVTR